MKALPKIRLLLLASVLALPACGAGEDVEETSGGDPGEMGAGSVEEMFDGVGADPTGGTAGPGPAASGAATPGSPATAGTGPGAAPAGAPVDSATRTAP